jgi:hypothetical protein
MDEGKDGVIRGRMTYLKFFDGRKEENKEHSVGLPLPIAREFLIRPIDRQQAERNLARSSPYMKKEPTVERA